MHVDFCKTLEKISLSHTKYKDWEKSSIWKVFFFFFFFFLSWRQIIRYCLDSLTDWIDCCGYMAVVQWNGITTNNHCKKKKKTVIGKNLLTESPFTLYRENLLPYKVTFYLFIDLFICHNNIFELFIIKLFGGFSANIDIGDDNHVLNWIANLMLMIWCKLKGLGNAEDWQPTREIVRHKIWIKSQGSSVKIF